MSEALEQARAAARAAREFVVEHLGARFTLRMPPFAEFRERMRAIGEDQEARQAAVHEFIAEGLVGWEGVTLGLLTMNGSAAPFPWEDGAPALLFSERPDIEAVLSNRLFDALMNRVASMETERKNFASTSSPS